MRITPLSQWVQFISTPTVNIGNWPAIQQVAWGTPQTVDIGNPQYAPQGLFNSQVMPNQAALYSAGFILGGVLSFPLAPSPAGATVWIRQLITVQKAGSSGPTLYYFLFGSNPTNGVYLDKTTPAGAYLLDLSSLQGVISAAKDAGWTSYGNAMIAEANFDHPVSLTSNYLYVLPIIEAAFTPSSINEYLLNITSEWRYS